MSRIQPARFLLHVFVLVPVVGIGILAICQRADCGQPGKVETGRSYSLKTRKGSRIEVLRKGPLWRIDTFWYSVVPGRDSLIMFNDANKKFTYADASAMELNRNSLNLRATTKFGAATSASYFGGMRYPFSWSKWTKTRDEKVNGVNLTLFTRTATGKVFKQNIDATTGYLNDLIPAASDAGRSVSSQAGSERKLLRNVKAKEELWVMESEKAPDLLQVFRVLFGCDTSFGLPLKDVESIEGTDKTGKPSKVTITYVKLAEVKPRDLKDASFKLPKGYKQVPDQFSVMMDDAGSEQLMYTAE